MKAKFKLINLIVILILIFYSLHAAAYFKPETYNKSLLDIRDAERSIYKLEEKLKSAEENFRILSKEEIENKKDRLDNLYQEIILKYKENKEKEVTALAAEITAAADKITLGIIESKPVQLRAFWLDSGSFAKTGGRAGVQKLLDLTQKANFNLIFPEVYYKGLTVIPDSELFRQDPRFNSWQEDPLKVLIEEAKKRKIEVHPWVWVLNENTEGRAGRILRENPEWANKNKDGEIITYHNSSWLSPAREDIREYLKKRYKYFVENYDIDGINLDYIRFPEEYRGSFGYDKKSVERFEKEYGIDPFEIKSGSKESSLWNNYRENLITEVVSGISKILREVDPDLLISADVIPGRDEARFRALQNWSLWLEKGYLDFVIPMTYTENLFSELRNWIKKDRQELDQPLYAGISVFKLTSEQLITQLEEINQINPNGMSLFAAAHLKEQDYESLAAGIFKKSALLPYENREQNLRLMQDFILKRLNIIKEAEKISNKDIISIREYLNQIITTPAAERVDFNRFCREKDLELSAAVKSVLEKDFNYLEDLIRLY